MILKMFVNNGRVHCVEDHLDLKYDKMMMILCLCHSVQVKTEMEIIAHHLILLTLGRFVHGVIGRDLVLDITIRVDRHILNTPFTTIKH